MSEINRIFTYINCYDGGTYIWQTNADSIVNAAIKWIRNNEKPQNMLSLSEIDLFIKDIISGEEPIVPISGVNNVWGFSVRIKGILATIHIVESIAV